MQNVFKDTFTVRSYESSPDKFVSIPSICNYFQESAWKHAEELGLGFKSLADRNLYWVLTKFIISLESLPGWGETAEVHTWPKGKKGFYALRDFLLLLPGGTVSAKASSAWIVLNTETLRPVHLDFTDAILNYSTGDPALDWDFAKIPQSGENLAQIPITVTYSDLDVNNHVNNVNYIKWVLDLFYPLFPEREIRSLEMHYIAEALFRDNLMLSISSAEKPDSFIFECLRHRDNKTIFRGIIR